MIIQCRNVPIHSHNQAAIDWAVSEKPPNRAKHIDVRVHFIRELVKKLLLDVVHVPREETGANMLSKPFGRAVLRSFMERIRL